MSGSSDGERGFSEFARTGGEHAESRRPVGILRAMRSVLTRVAVLGLFAALGACGVAFFLRAVRAASQGGIEIGFSSSDALMIASQTAVGAAGLLLENGHHPEQEIDRVTTPRGCTIAGLNRMEHEGFSAAMVTGITTSAAKIDKLY